MRAGLIQPEPLSAAAVWLDQGVSVTWIDLGVEWSRCSAVKDEGPIKRDYSITPKHISRSSIRLNLPPPPQTLSLSLSPSCVFCHQWTSDVGLPVAPSVWGLLPQPLRRPPARTPTDASARCRRRACARRFLPAAETEATATTNITFSWSAVAEEKGRGGGARERGMKR